MASRSPVKVVQVGIYLLHMSKLPIVNSISTRCVQDRIIEIHSMSLITVLVLYTGALPRWVNLGSQGSSPVWIGTAKTQ